MRNGINGRGGRRLFMPDSHLSWRSEALQRSEPEVVLYNSFINNAAAATEAMNTSTCFVGIFALRRDDNSPFFSIVRQLGTLDYITLEKIGEQWRKLDSTIRSTLEINGEDWKEKAQNLSNYFHSAADLVTKR